MLFLAYTIAVVGGYLLGSIPTGYLMGKARGVDVRREGSGNIGATNVFRTLGRTAGIVVLGIDCLKGLLAATVLASLAAQVAPASPTPELREQLAIAAGVASVLGHNFTCWLDFKGGKGVATSSGVLLAWVPWGLLIILAVWLLVVGLTRYVSLGSICAAITLPIAVWSTHGSGRMIIITSLLSALALFKHRANMKRLWRGTEHRIGANPPVSVL